MSELHWRDDEGPLEALRAHPNKDYPSHADLSTHDHHDHHHATSRLRAWANLERRDIAMIVVFAISVGTLSLLSPIAAQTLVNTVAFGTIIQPVIVLMLLLFGGLALSGLIKALEYLVVEHIQRRIFFRVALDIAHRIPRVPMAFWKRQYGPELVNRFFDSITAQKTSSTLLLDGLSLALQAGIGMIVLAFYHPLLLAFDVALLVGLFVLTWGVGRGAIAANIQESQAKYAVAARLEELARLPQAHQLGGTRSPTVDIERAIRYWLSQRIASFRILFRQVIGGMALHAIASASLLGLGGILVIKRQLTLGQLVAAELIVSGVVAAFEKWGKQLESFYDLLAATDKIGHITDLPQESIKPQIQSTEQSAKALEVNLHEVSLFSGERRILHIPGLAFSSGTSTCILGSSGSGKTLFAQAMSSLHTPAQGRVLINGHHGDLRQHRRSIALIEPIGALHASILDNMTLHDTGISESQVLDLLDALGVLNAVLALPEQLHTVLLPNGSPLSSSETSMILVARALIRRPQLLIVDAALDGLAEPMQQRVLDLLLAPQRPWTLVMLTQRHELQKRFDHSYTIAQGVLGEPTALLPEGDR